MSRLSDDELDEALAVAQSPNSLRLTAAVAELKERRAQDMNPTDIEHNAELQKATRMVMAHLLDTGHDKLSVAYHTLEHVLADLEHDRAALLKEGGQ